MVTAVANMTLLQPLYGMPAPQPAAQYSQYPGYGAWPAGAGAPGADGAAAAQWPAGQDPSAFPQQNAYWGGYYGQPGAAGADGTTMPLSQ